MSDEMQGESDDWIGGWLRDAQGGDYEVIWLAAWWRLSLTHSCLRRCPLGCSWERARCWASSR